MTGKTDLLQQPLVLQAIALLRAIHKPTDDALLADALAAECLGCHPADLGRLFRACRDQKCS